MAGEEEQESTQSQAAKKEDAAARRARQRAQRRPPPPSMWTAPQSFIPPPNPADQPTDRQAQAYFRRVTRPHLVDGPLPSRGQRLVNLGAGFLATAATLYLVLLHDFGPREHVFMPVRRFLSIDEVNPLSLSREDQRWAQQKRIDTDRTSKGDEKLI